MYIIFGPFFEKKTAGSITHQIFFPPSKKNNKTYLREVSFLILSGFGDHQKLAKDF